MAKPALPVPPARFDDSKFAAMIEPFTVRIEKFRGSQRMPIPMPAISEDQPGGVGYDADTIRDIEQWLVTEWAGGGNYEIVVTDSSTPALSMKWHPSWDVKAYPDKIPPPLQGIAEQQQVQSYPVPGSMGSFNPNNTKQGLSMPSFPNGLPGGGIPQFSQNPYYPQQPQYQPPPLPNPPMPGTHQWGAWQQESERREREAKMQRLQDQADAREREAQEAKHKAELDRERQQNEARFQAQAHQLTEMKNMFAALQVTLQQNAQAPRPNAEVEALREQHRQTEARLERERHEREAERRESSMRDMIREMKETSQRQIEMLTRQFEERTRSLEMAAQNNNRPDQMLMMWKESTREGNEAMKELARNQTQQMQAFQSYMMKPQDIMSMARESSSSVDQATERVTNFFGRVIDTQQKVTENLLQMQPSSSGVVELVGSGIDRVGSAVEKYIGGKQLEAQLTQQGQVQVAQAQAQAYAAAAQAQAYAAQGHVPAHQSNGLSGIPVEHAEALASPIDQAHAEAQAQTNGTPKPEVKRLGRTDEQWFGPILNNVLELRRQAGEFIESLKQDPPRIKNKKIVGLQPYDAAGATIQAVQICVQKQIAIPAMMDLLFQGRFADFVDVLLPNVTQPYRDDVTKILLKVGKDGSGQMPPDPNAGAEEPAADEDEDADEDEEDNGDDGDDSGDDDPADADDNTDDNPESDKAQDGKVKPPAPVTTPPKMRVVTPRA